MLIIKINLTASFTIAKHLERCTIEIELCREQKIVITDAGYVAMVNTDAMVI